MQTVSKAEAIEQRLVQAMADLGPELSDVKRDATLEELDIDSLDLVELAQIAEDEFGAVLAPDDVKEVVTVGDAIDLVIAHAK
jgi:acyl carrier protein